jgi:NCAIR mutase (PurE)-related protein
VFSWPNRHENTHRSFLGSLWQSWGVQETTLRAMLDDLVAGRVSADEVVARLRRLPFADVDGALVDHHRALRQGMPEAVFARGKSPEQCARIVTELLANGDGPVLVTRVSGDQVKAVEAAVGPGTIAAGCLLYRAPEVTRDATVVVAAAGTADRPVADECELTLRAYGFAARRLDDIGVAGLHRLLANIDVVQAADAVVVVAGMEGALASVVGGLTAAPVVAVPTSVGYGASLEGVTALLAMLASCASGVTVVGIDNGFGAACAVTRMMRSP